MVEAIKTDALREKVEAEAARSLEASREKTMKKPPNRTMRQTASVASPSATLAATSALAGSDESAIRRAEQLDGPEARRRIELQTKFNKVEVVRQADQKFIRERAEKHKTMRDDRFKRLVDAVCDHGGLAMECAENLAAFEQRYQQRRWDLYAQWDEHVSHPLAKQAFDYINPADRVAQQKLNGSKSVSWKLPHEKPQLKLDVSKDPARRQLYDTEAEKNFHEVAETVLGRSRSSPEILRRSAMRDPRAVGTRALSRPVLEPTDWGQQQLQGTLFGRFVQACEEGPNFTRARRGGTNVFVPDETDGIEAAGTRFSRLHGHHDMGILRGDTGSQGETSNFKTHEGSSSGAPAQDHFTFQHSREITDLEFPLGKKVFPEFH